MKKVISKLLIIFVAFSFAFSSTAWAFLTEYEIDYLESNIRKSIKLQEASVQSSLYSIYADIDKFLYGPTTAARIDRFYDKYLKNNSHQSEDLWQIFKKEVLTKKQFDRLIDDLIELHFRVYERSRLTINRDFSNFGLSGISQIDYSELKIQLKTSISEIWSLEYDKIKELIFLSNEEISEALKARKIVDIINYTALGLDVIGAVVSSSCPPCGIALFIVSAVMVAGSLLYEKILLEDTIENQINTARQKFKNKIAKVLRNISNNTKSEFRKTSKTASTLLFANLRTLIVEKYPQLKVENLI